MKFSSPLSVSLSLLASALSVSAHGYVQNVTIGSKVYGGWLPFDSPYASPPTKSVVRNIRDDGPVTSITDPALACNYGGEKAAALTADINAGQDIKFTMNRWPDDHLGPVTVYMASCGGSCDSFDPSKGDVWFKIEQSGLQNGQWATSKLIAQGLSWTVAVPSELKSGQYLIRLELLALHSAGAPQFYPSCTQLNVKGGGSDVASKSSLVSIPGIYANAGNAIYGDIWNEPKSWPIAGPKVVSFASGGDGGNGGDDDTPAPSSSSPVASPSKTPASSSTRAPVGVVGSPSASIPTSSKPVPTTTSKGVEPTGKSCKRNTKRARETYERALDKERDAGADRRRAWSSHGKAKRARSFASGRH